MTVLIGVLSVWPLLYLVFFFIFFATAMFSVMSAPGAKELPLPSVFRFLFPLHMLTILLMFVLLAVYIVHAYRSDQISNDRRILWVIILLFGGMIAFPVYWYLYLWRAPRAALLSP